MSGVLPVASMQETCVGVASHPFWLTPPSWAHSFQVDPAFFGFEWQDRLGRYCLVTHVVSGAPRAATAQQAELVLERIQFTLSQAGFTFRDVVRTWFFLHDILRWYETFNGVRTRFLRQHGLLGRMPASTAVGMPLGEHGAIVAGALAFSPGSDDTRVCAVASPKQGSALDYGSSFSRAIEIAWQGGKRLLVSGTASIDSGGRSLHGAATGEQIKETLRVIEALLRSRELDMSDVSHAICYVADREEIAMARSVAGEFLPRNTPWIHATICRPELEFEVELIASRFAGAGNGSFW